MERSLVREKEYNMEMSSRVSKNYEGHSYSRDEDTNGKKNLFINPTLSKR